MNLRLLCLPLLFLGASWTRAAEAAPRSAVTLTLADFYALVEEPAGGLILDTRSDHAFRQGHVPGALSLSATRFGAAYATLRERLEADKNRRLVLYCDGAHCGASEQVRVRLLALGFTRLEIFPEGWGLWRESGLPVEKSPGADQPLPPWYPQ